MSEIALYRPQSLAEMEKFSQIVNASKLAPKHFDTPQKIFVAVQKGADLGLSPMQSLESIAVINGKTALSGDAMLAVVRNSGQLEKIKEEVSGEGMDMVAKVHVVRKGGEEATVSFSAHDAKLAGLWGKPGPWSQYPKRMIKYRARAFALRDMFSDILLGMAHSAEELRDGLKGDDVMQDVSSDTVSNNFANGGKVMDVVVQKDSFTFDGEVVGNEAAYEIIMNKIETINTTEDLHEYEQWKNENSEELRTYGRTYPSDAAEFKKRFEERRDALYP